MKKPSPYRTSGSPTLGKDPGFNRNIYAGKRKHRGYSRLGHLSFYDRIKTEGQRLMEYQKRVGQYNPVMYEDVNQPNFVEHFNTSCPDPRTCFHIGDTYSTRTKGYHGR